MDEAERVAGERSDLAGIGVGMTTDYGAAQLFCCERFINSRFTAVSFSLGMGRIKSKLDARR